MPVGTREHNKGEEEPEEDGDEDEVGAEGADQVDQAHQPHEEEEETEAGVEAGGCDAVVWTAGLAACVGHVGAVGVEGRGQSATQGEPETACNSDRLSIIFTVLGKGGFHCLPNEQKTTKEKVFPRKNSRIPPRLMRKPPMK